MDDTIYIAGAPEKSPAFPIATIPIWVWIVIVIAIIWIVWGILSVSTLNLAIALPFLFVTGFMAGFGNWLLAENLVVGVASSVEIAVVWSVLVNVLVGLVWSVVHIVRSTIQNVSVGVV